MRDPERLAAGTDELAGLLASAGDDVLDDAAVDRVRASMEVAGVLAAGTVVAAPALGALKGLLGATSTKIAALLIAGAAVAAGYTYLAAGAAPLSAAPVDAPAATAPRDLAPPTIAAPVVAPDLAPLATIAPAPVASALPARRSGASPAPSARAPRDLAPPQPATSPRDGLLLLQARHALAGDPQRALDLVRRHEEEFPGSQLAPERAQLRRDAIAAGAK